MDVLSSRVLLHPADRDRSQRFYRDTVGLAIYREFGDPANPGIVFYLGGGFLEVSGAAEPGAAPPGLSLWMQVRDVATEYQRLVGLEAVVLRPPAMEPWGLVEMWIEDPDGVRIVLVQVPDEHPLRRDSR